jgi:hypothetical protein
VIGGSSIRPLVGTSHIAGFGDTGLAENEGVAAFPKGCGLRY